MFSGIQQPGAVYKESDCKVCQCIDNAYVCDTETCTKKIVQSTDIPFEGEDDMRQNQTEKLIIQQQVYTSTVTPPANCDAGK